MRSLRYFLFVIFTTIVVGRPFGPERELNEVSDFLKEDFAKLKNGKRETLLFKMMPPPQVQVYPQPKRDGALESYADLSEAKRGRLGCRPRPGASWCTGKRVVLGEEPIPSSYESANEDALDDLPSVENF